MMFPAFDILPYLINVILAICITIGAFFAVRNGKQAGLAAFQEKNIKAFQDRIKILEDKIADFEKENVIQRHLIELITDALKKRGLIITIDGEMITIEDMKGTRTTHHKRTITTQASVIKKTEEGN